MEKEAESLCSSVNLNFLETYLPIWDPIKEFSCTPVTPFGNSVLLLPWMIPPVHQLRVGVTFTGKKAPLNILLKTPIAEHATVTRKRKCFHKETFFYDELNPRLNKLVSNCKISVPFFSAASISDVSDEPLETFVALKDASKSKFVVAEDLDFAHAALVIKELAKVAALGWLYKKSKAVLSLQVLHPLLTEATLTADNLLSLNNNTLLMSLALPEIQALGSNQMEMLLSNGQTMSEMLPLFLTPSGFCAKDFTNICDSSEELECRWGTLCHGDICRENLLFKYTEGIPEEVMLLNWHSVRESCLSLDIGRLLMTSKITHDEEIKLVEMYHEHFTSIIVQANKECPVGFTLEMLTERLKLSKIFAQAVNLLQNLPSILKEELTEKDKESWKSQLVKDGNAKPNIS